MTATLAPSGGHAETLPAQVVGRSTVGAAVLQSFVRPQWWMEILALGVLYGLYSVVRNSVGNVVTRAYGNGREILALEGLGAGARTDTERLGARQPGRAVALHYATLHFLVTASGAPGSDAVSNQFAAMPSLHCAWAAWCGLVLILLAGRTWIRLVGALYPLSTFFVVMGSGNHYLLDVAAGVLVLCLGAALVHVTAPAWARRQQTPRVPADDLPLPAVAWQ